MWGTWATSALEGVLSVAYHACWLVPAYLLTLLLSCMQYSEVAALAVAVLARQQQQQEQERGQGQVQAGGGSAGGGGPLKRGWW